MSSISALRMKNALRLLGLLLVLLPVGLTIFWFSRPFDVDFESLRSEVPHAGSSHFIDIDGLRVHYQESGAGTPLVLVHGFMASTADWKDVFPLLSDRYRVIALDLKGFGFSGKPSGDYGPASQAELVLQLLDRLKIDKVALCGQSMGANVALRLAARHPERVSALVLVDAAGLRIPQSETTDPAPGYARWPVVGPLVTALALSSDQVVRAGLRTCYYNPTNVTEERVATCHRVLRTRAGLAAAMSTKAQGPAELDESTIAKIRQPTLVVWGEEDLLIPVKTAKRFTELIHGSRLVVFDRCGHAPQVEMPGRLAKEVSNFLSSLSGHADGADLPPASPSVVQP